MTQFPKSLQRLVPTLATVMCLIGAHTTSANPEPAELHAESLTGDPVALLHRCSLSLFEILPGEWWANEPINFRAVVSPVPIAEGREQPPQKGNWERLAKALANDHTNQATGIRLRATVISESDVASPWQDQKPLDAVALAEASRKLVPDGTIWSLRDTSALIEFLIPGNTLRPGYYRILLHYITSDGLAHNFPTGSTPQTAATFRVVGSDTRKLLPATLKDAPILLRHANMIACPAHNRFPLDTPDDCQARSIWSLQAFEGKVYCGYGDWARNRGPIDVWSFEPRTALTDVDFPPRLTFRAGESDSLVFLHQFVVQEESIDSFRVCEGKLVIPGIDGCKEVSPPDSHLFGNIYVREAGYWRKLSTLPKAAHVMDAIFFGGRLFAYVQSPTGDLFVSENAGISWNALPHDPDLVPSGFATLGKDLIVLAGGGGALRYRDGRLEAHRQNLVPGSLAGTVHRPTAFRDGLVYTLWHNWGRVRERSYPLYFLPGLDKPPVAISIFKDATVKDIVAEGSTLYVLTARPNGNSFIAEIFESQDLNNWTRDAEVTMPASPNAMARLGSTFFIGLANRGYDPATCSDYRANLYAYADKDSGEIWQVTAR